MHAATDRLEFAPPQQPGFVRSLILALMAHLLLLAALTWGVHWKREAENLSVEAELWSAVPQQAAPKLVEAPPAPPPPPPPAEKIETKPPPPPVVSDADIALERDKKRREADKQRELEQQRREAEKQKLRAQEDKLEQKKKADADKKKQEAREKEREKAQLEKERQEKKELDAKRKAEVDARQQKEADAKRLEAQRLENIKRAQGMAGGTGAPDSQGTAQQSSGPSASYGGRVAAVVKPKIVYPDDIAANPKVVVQVRNAPDGTIIGRKILEPSGNKAWDEAVMRALEKTERMPRDADGRVPPQFEIGFRPKD